MGDKSLDILRDLYHHLPMPVIICQSGPGMPVVHMNRRASLILSPASSVVWDDGVRAHVRTLDSCLKFLSPEGFRAFAHLCAQTGRLEGYQGWLLAFDGREIPVSVSGNSVSLDAPEDHFVLYMTESTQTSESAADDLGLLSVINAAFLGSDVEDSIKAVLAMAGKRLEVSRVYVFEEISATAIRNTYEWCADGVEPVIDTLSELKKEDYNHDAIMSSGMYIVNAASKLSAAEREIAQSQGIQAIAVMTMYDSGRPFGLVGLDDCQRERDWSFEELATLRHISLMLTMLIKRRNAERMARDSFNVLELVSDNLDDIIYANTLDDYRLVFVSKSAGDILGVSSSELVGQRCYDVFGDGSGGPCARCPISLIKIEKDARRGTGHVWEHRKARFGDRVYLAKDNVLRWVDGRMVHLQTAVDISERIAYEEHLRFYASTDVLTGVYKREWAGKTLEAMMLDPDCGGSLIFLDIDRLKHVNDTLGHSCGDQMIKDIVSIIKEQLPQDALFCRWGGDEFLIWMNGMPGEADGLLKDIQATMAEYSNKKSSRYKLSFSYGVVPFEPGPEASLDALITRSDQLMYRDKTGKRGEWM